MRPCPACTSQKSDADVIYTCRVTVVESSLFTRRYKLAMRIINVMINNLGSVCVVLGQCMAHTPHSLFVKVLSSVW